MGYEKMRFYLRLVIFSLLFLLFVYPISSYEMLDDDLKYYFEKSHKEKKKTANLWQDVKKTIVDMLVCFFHVVVFKFG
jgi:uncharacterized membrane protein SpoIIM required for sporulation